MPTDIFLLDRPNRFLVIGRDVTPKDPDWPPYLARVALSRGALHCAVGDILENTGGLTMPEDGNSKMPLPMMLADQITPVIQGPVPRRRKAAALVEQVEAQGGWIGPKETMVITRGQVLRAIALAIPALGRIDGHTAHIARLRQMAMTPPDSATP